MYIYQLEHMTVDSDKTVFFYSNLKKAYAHMSDIAVANNIKIPGYSTINAKLNQFPDLLFVGPPLGEGPYFSHVFLQIYKRVVL